MNEEKMNVKPINSEIRLKTQMFSAVKLKIKQ